MSVPQSWHNRIIRTGEVEVSRVLTNKRNWRGHPAFQQDSLLDAIEEVGIVKSILINQRISEQWPLEERNETMIDGHLRVALAMKNGQKTLPAEWCDLTPEEESLVLASLDPISSMAISDTKALEALLQEVSTESGPLLLLFDDLSHQIVTTGPLGDGKFLDLGDRKTHIKPALYIDQIRVFEQALMKTGRINRGEALIAICRHYLGEIDVSR